MIWTWRGARAPRSSCTPSLEPHGAATRQCCSVTLWGRRRGGGSPCHCTAVGGPEIRGAASSCREKRGPFGFPLSSPCRGPADIALGGGCGAGGSGDGVAMGGCLCCRALRAAQGLRHGDVGAVGTSIQTVGATGTFMQRGHLHKRGSRGCWCNGNVGAVEQLARIWGRLCSGAVCCNGPLDCNRGVRAAEQLVQRGCLSSRDGGAMGMVVQ